MLARNISAISRSSQGLLCRQTVGSPLGIATRSYAWTRHEERKLPGGGRTRPRVSRKETDSERVERESQPYSPYGYEEKPSSDESQLWGTSQRPPSSNPEEGLRNLLMSNQRLIVTRQIEMLNIFVGFEQSNRYVITNEQEQTLGYIAEEPRGLFSIFARQLFRTHRPFRAVVMDEFGSPILWLRRPLAWINSRMFVQQLKDLNTYTPDGEPVLDTFAEVQQRWHLWRRKYDLFLRHKGHRVLSVLSDPQPEPEIEPDTFNQLARIDERFLAWDFTLKDANGNTLASINRAFRGFGREIFTDTGRYSVNFSPQPQFHGFNPFSPFQWPGQSESQTVYTNGEEIFIPPAVTRDLTLEERALVLATAVNIDFDYFSRHSGGGGLGIPFFAFGE
ncbi:Scramblase-domain-containing protein [Abortiporus biennis]|nr:Scramblase-domain-containing protein [Abortiporus biennis]